MLPAGSLAIGLNEFCPNRAPGLGTPIYKTVKGFEIELRPRRELSRGTEGFEAQHTISNPRRKMNAAVVPADRSPWKIRKAEI
jgi:hypothetical protein